MQSIQHEEVTRLNLLTRDGAISAEFRPALDQRQYDELHVLVDEFDSIDVAKALISDAAKRWEREVEF
jgi:hypothetical protein